MELNYISVKSKYSKSKSTLTTSRQIYGLITKPTLNTVYEFMVLNQNRLCVRKFKPIYEHQNFSF